MAVLTILHWPAPLLSARAAPVTGVTDGIRQLAKDMLDTMYAAQGRGLAAPQVGVSQRMFVMDIGWKAGSSEPVICLNPEILWHSDVVAPGPEGCLSIPGPAPMIRRAQAVRMVWQDLDGNRHESRLAGMAAICAQHEYDHLDGILTLDRLTPAERTLAEAQVTR